MLGRPVIRREYLSAKTKVLLFSVSAIVLLTTGFVAGVSVVNTNAVSSPPPPTETEIELPTSSDNSLELLRQADRIKKKVKAAQRWNPEKVDKEVECLAKNIYFEARDQEIHGQVAVGLVTINRVLSDKYPDTICDVVWQKRKHPKTGRWVGQFSWTLDGKPNTPRNTAVWNEVYHLAQAMVAGRTLINFQDFTNGSTHYHASYVQPFWMNHLTKTTEIGDHIFYRDEKATPIPPVATISSDGL